MKPTKITFNVDTIIAVIVCLLSVFGMISFFDLRVFGITITLYRMLIPVILFYYFITSYRKKLLETLNIIPINVRIFVFFFAIWICYGFAQLMFRQNISIPDALKELLSLVLGYMCILIVSVLSFKDVKIKVFLLTIKCIFIVLLAFAYIETIFGIHLESSKISEISQMYPEYKFLATTIFYNVNDYAAFIAIFLPLFFVSQNTNNKKEMVLNTVVIFLSVTMILRLDAWISFVAICFTVIMSVVLSALKRGRDRSKKIKNSLITALTIILAYKLGRYFLIILNNILKNSTIELYTHEAANIEIGDVFSSQLGEGAGTSSGITRINTYFESIGNMFKDTFGLGYGPSNFGGYLHNSTYLNKETLLENPHSLWVEIFVQYGVFIFAAYAITLVVLYIGLIKVFFKENSNTAMAVILMSTSFSLSAFNPSTFLEYSYQWLLIGIVVAILIQYRDRKPKKELIHESRSS